VRRATPVDVVALATVHAVTTGRAYAGIFPSDAPKPTVDELAVLWQERVAAAGDENPARAAVLVVDDDTTGPAIPPIIGLVAFTAVDASPFDHQADVVLLRSFYVLPDHWDRGLGRALHESMVAEAHAWGATAIDVPVLEGNERGRAWYVRHRYEPIGARLPAFGDLDLWDEGLRLAAPFT
jgi:GNAT superfamily N-acetyltransferase